MKISICFGTRNRLETLKRVLDNIPPYAEIVIVDGKSQDGTAEFLSSTNDDRVIPILEDNRSGYPNFMNKAIKASTGDLIVQWNDDAFMVDGGWDALLAGAEENKKAAGFRFPYRNVQKFPPKKMVNFGKPPWLSFGCYRRSTFGLYGIYHPDIRFYHCDTELCKRVLILAGTNSLPYLDACKVCHLNNASGRTRSKQDKQSKRDASKCKSICTQTRSLRKVPLGVPVLSSA